MDGWMDGWTDGRMDGRTLEHSCFPVALIIIDHSKPESLYIFCAHTHTHIYVCVCIYIYM